MPVLRGAHRETPKAGERSTRAMNQTDVMVADETVGPVADPVGIVVGDSLRVRVASVIVLAIVACLAVWHGWERGMVLAPTDGLQLVAVGEAGHRLCRAE